MARSKPLAEQLQDAIGSEKVRAALRARAARALPAARSIALQQGAAVFADALHIEEGTRPGTHARDGLKRPYARVTADVTDEMRRKDGRTRLTRQMILRRAAASS